MAGHLIALWRYREFVLGRVRAEILGRYRGSSMGLAWLLLQPLAQIIVFTIVFAAVMRARLPGIEGGFAYSVYLCSGLLPWFLFTDVLGRSQSMFVDHGHLLRKIYFPRICLPVIVVLSALATFAVFVILFTVFLLLVGHWPGRAALAALPVLLLQLVLAAGLGTALGVLHVFFRDVGHALQTVLQFWFWLTPIVYPLAIVPERFRVLIRLNPMTPVVGAYQDVFLLHQVPNWGSLGPVLVLALLLGVLAMWLFRRHEDDLVDEL